MLIVPRGPSCTHWCCFGISKDGERLVFNSVTCSKTKKKRKGLVALVMTLPCVSFCLQQVKRGKAGGFLLSHGSIVISSMATRERGGGAHQARAFSSPIYLLICALPSSPSPVKCMLPPPGRNFRYYWILLKTKFPRKNASWRVLYNVQYTIRGHLENRKGHLERC